MTRGVVMRLHEWVPVTQYGRIIVRSRQGREKDLRYRVVVYCRKKRPNKEGEVGVKDRKRENGPHGGGSERRGVRET